MLPPKWPRIAQKGSWQLPVSLQDASRLSSSCPLSSLAPVSSNATLGAHFRRRRCPDELRSGREGTTKGPGRDHGGTTEEA
eukprot:8819365-Pyramimonas_sp.AAC.1